MESRNRDLSPRPASDGRGRVGLAEQQRGRFPPAHPRVGSRARRHTPPVQWFGRIGVIQRFSPGSVLTLTVFVLCVPAP